MNDLLPALLLPLPGGATFDTTPFVTSIVLFCVTFLAFYVLHAIVLARLQALSKRTSTDWDDFLIGTLSSVHSFVYVLVAAFVAVQPLSLPSWLDMTFRGVFFLIVVWQLIEIATRLVAFVAKKYLEKDKDSHGVIDPNTATASDMIQLIARIALWSMGLLFVLSNLGIEVTSLIAGLGIGGIAVAFALQGILSDLFASFSIYFDKPFRVGDYIVLGADSGTVEKIGIKSTRIRTLQGEELVVSNAELTTTRVQNFKKMQKRRVVATVGITYETAHEQVKQVPTIVADIFKNLTHAELDRVHFVSFGDSALLFEIVYFIDSSDYVVYLDVQQQFNFALLDRFAAAGIDFAYPTQTVHVMRSS